LFSKPFYKAIGEEDNRNRRERRVFTIKNKLMCLDFVLANRRHRFLATESEKLESLRGNSALTDHACRRGVTSCEQRISRLIVTLLTSFPSSSRLKRTASGVSISAS
jgi:hypothetical protein